MSMKASKPLTLLLSVFLISIVLAASFLLMPTRANAGTTEDTTQTIEVEILSPEQAKELLSQEQPKTKGRTNITMCVIRNSGTNCELYVKWAGSDLYNSFRYKRMIVRKNSTIDKEVYLNQYDQYKWFYVNAPATAIGFAHAAYLNIPTNVSKIYIEARQFQGYNLSAASWVANDIKGPGNV